MSPKRILSLAAIGLALSSLVVNTGQAQTATWIGPSSGGEWNTLADWDIGLPGVGTNAIILGNTNVSYNFPMAAASFGGLTDNGVLNINTNGFNCSSISLVATAGGDKLFINTNAVVTVSGAVNLGTNAVATMTAGSSLTAGSLTVSFGLSSKAGGTAAFTNSGGTYSANSTTVNNNSGTGNGLLVISGGTNNLGNTIVGRSSAGSGGFNTLGTEGLIIYNGQVSMTNLNLGNGNAVSYLTAMIAGGTVTNYGSVFINQSTAARASRLLQTNGLFVVPDPGVVNPNGTVSGSISIFSVINATSVLGGLYFGNSNASASTVNFTNSGAIYVGSQGITGNGAVTLNAALNSGGLFGATAPWTGSAAMRLTGGTFTFQAADQVGTANNITLSGVLSGVGNLNKTGAGTLTLEAADNYSGNTFINIGSLALGSGGSLVSPNILVGSGASFDVSQLGSFTLNAAQTLSGFGAVTGVVNTVSGSAIYPGSNLVTGTLTMATGLTENGGAINEFTLSNNPLGPGNDFLSVPGALTLGGTNTILINGSLKSGGAYPLISYGSLVGDVTNFTVAGASGSLSNSTSAQIIYFVAQTSVRGPTNITWVGNATVNNWDVEISTNWLNNGTGLLDYFVPNDNPLFSNLGAINPLVNIPGTVTPGSVTINTTSNYTFTGAGGIGGTGGLTVSNGSLTILTTNTYTGPTILDGGVLASAYLANSGNPSAIGEATADPGNVILNGGTLSYFGPSVGIDHGITLTNGGGTFDVTNETTLTLNGALVGPGGLTLIDLGTLTMAAGNSYAGNTVISNGTLNLKTATAAGTGTIVVAGGTLGLTTSSQPTYANNLSVTADSTLNSAGGNNNILGGDWTGNTNITLNVLIASGGTFTVNGSMTNFLGTVELGDSAGFFRFNSGGGNTMFGAPNSTIDLGTNTTTLEARNPGTMAVGALEGGDSTIVTGPSATAGSLIWQIGSDTNNPSTIFYGTIAKTSNTNELSGITKIGSGTLALAGQNTYTLATTISSGTLALTNNPFTTSDGSIDDSTPIDVAAGAVLSASGRSDGTLQLGNSSAQVLQGVGTVQGNLSVGGSGTVAPGGGLTGSIGTLTVTNTVTLGGTAWMKINRTNSPNSDLLVSSLSSINYGGTLVVTNVGAHLQAGDTFTLFSAAGGFNSTAFATVVLPGYYSWDTSQLGGHGIVSVTGFVSPAFTNVDFTQLTNGTITLNSINGAPNGPYSVLSSTNVTAPLSQWTSVTNGNFDINGNMNGQSGLSLTVDPASPQEFYILVGK